MSQPRSGAAIALLVLWSLGGAARAQDSPIVVTLLGTGSPTPSIDRFGPSTLVQAGGQNLLFDIGRGAHQRLAQVGVTAAQIDAVFLTHLHSDHFVGMPDLWLTGWLTSSRSRPWIVRGPSGTAEMFDRLSEAFSVDVKTRVVENEGHLPAAGGQVTARNINAGVVYEQNGLRVTAITVDHRAIAPAYGYRIDFGRRSVVLSGDTTVSPELVEAAKGTDLLVHEVYDVSDDLMKANPRSAVVASFHVNGEQAGRIFQQTQPKLAAYSHIVLRGLTTADLVRRTRSVYRGPLAVGEDLMRFIVDESVTVMRP